jgi:DNA-binding beta-propeller fold protein YncE
LATSTVSTLAVPLNGGSAISSDGSYALLCDQIGAVIRKYVFATSTATIIAGSGSNGWKDGVGTAAQFNIAYGFAFSPDGTYALIADAGNNAIRKIDLTTFTVTTVAGICSGSTFWRCSAPRL